MSTSLLYHAWGTRGYEHVRTTYENGAVCFRIEQPDGTFFCPFCGCWEVQKAGTVVRRFRSLPIGGRTVMLELPVQRLWCAGCGRTRQADIGFADSKRSYTRAFERYVLDLSASMTIKDIARHLDVGWDLVKDIQKRNLTRRFARPKLKHLRHIAIDEICIGHGHRYLTVVLDLDSGAIVFVGQGKGADALKPFWTRLSASHARIKAVATDMSAAYTQAVRENLPKAIHVFDHFHVIKLFNDKLSDLRREVQREAETTLQKKVLKGTLWLLLKNPENLDPKRNEKQRLEEALKLNAPLATAYYLKEELRQLWNQADKRAAERFMDSWIGKAQASGIRMLQQFAVTLAAHRHGILAWYDCQITTAPLEGTNNKIRVLQRNAYGYRDQEFFRLKLYALHETTYALVG